MNLTRKAGHVSLVGSALQTQIRAESEAFPALSQLSQSERAVKHDRELAVFMELFWHLNPATTDPGAASPGFRAPVQLDRRSVPQNVPGCNPGASPCVAGQHTNTIIPDPTNPLDFDRYAYVRNNPINYKDPTGHCVEGADDYDSCMEWASMIENEWEFVNVITCQAGDILDGCVGWTAKEMELLYKTLSDFPLLDSIDDGSIAFVRVETNDFAGQYDPNNGNISISDGAWTTSPFLGIQDTFDFLPHVNNFQGTIAHELTHAAQYTHPELLDKYKEVVDQISPIEKTLFHLVVGLWYDWSVYDEYKDEAFYDQMIQDEYMALVVSGFLYDYPWP